MRHFALIALLTSASVTGCATVLGLDSGNALEGAPGTDGGADVTTVDTGGNGDSTGGDTSVTVSCASTQKMCSGACRDQNDPRYGCGPTACEACSGSNVTNFGCEADKCKIVTCAAGLADCDGDPSNGCEIDLSMPAHCGSCTKTCTGTTNPECSQGTCVSSCPANEKDCSGACVDLTSNKQHCGTCTNVCPSQNGVADCVKSLCTITCNPGYLDCNPNAPGCEQAEDAKHCGSGCKDCSVTYGPLHEVPVCSAGGCASAGCVSGWNECDGNPVNGCETFGPCTTPDAAPPPDAGCKNLNTACGNPTECCLPMICGGSLAISINPAVGGHCCFQTGPAPFPCAANPCCGTCMPADAGGGSICQ